MNEFNQNSRTLIVSFVVAIMVLIPLRFVEVGQEVAPVVLGESVTAKSVAPVLEAPYAEVENGMMSDCVSATEANEKVGRLEARLSSGELDEQQVADVLMQIEKARLTVCK